MIKVLFLWYVYKYYRLSRIELDFIFSFVNCISLEIFNQVGAMAHGKIDCDYINDFVSGYFHQNGHS